MMTLQSLSARLRLAAGRSARPSHDTDEVRVSELVQANHILAQQGVLDGFGHVSVRSASEPNYFYMSRSRAPELVTRADILKFGLDSAPVLSDGPAAYSERFIHGEIFSRRPDVQAIVHSHCPDVLPFTVTSAPMQALIHMAAFLGDRPAPVFEIRDVLGDDNRILVTEPRTGLALAKTLGDGAVVLMRGHGMTVVAQSVRMVVMRAVYTQVNARIISASRSLGEPVFLNAFEAKRTDPVDRPWERWLAQVDSAARRGR